MLTTADIFRLIGVGLGVVIAVLGVVLHIVEAKHGREPGCLPVAMVVGGIVTALSSLP